MNPRLGSFKVSGALMENNLVMFDVETRTTWPQLVAIATAGPQEGECLIYGRNNVATTWKFWKTLHPETVVMTNRNDRTTTIKPEWYGTNPYEDYHALREPLPYPLSRLDGRLSERDIVLGVHGDGGSAVVISESSVAHTVVGRSEIVLFSDTSSNTTFVFENQLDGIRRTFIEATPNDQGIPQFQDLQSKTLWSIDGIAVDGPLVGRRLAQMPALHLYWFAWSTFFPDTPILRASP